VSAASADSPEPTEAPPLPEGSLAVFDVDGVVADVRHRLHHLEGPWKDWDGFFEEARLDPVLAPGAELVRRLGTEHDIVWLTGRPEWLRRVTQRWMAAAGLPHDVLFMRPPHDFRPARFYKLDMLRLIERRHRVGIGAFIDDDPEVVDAVAAAGFPATLAEWVPRGGKAGRALREAQEKLGRT
jgi:phosphoglycolate phosphatase-like HAD superfamily hydrolase